MHPCFRSNIVRTGLANRSATGVMLSTSHGGTLHAQWRIATSTHRVPELTGIDG